jgi:serine/threonine protein kinase
MLGNPNLNTGAEPFPGYRLVRFLGRGGFGEVWEAQSPAGKPKALKFLPCDAGQKAAREIRALQAIRQVRHPHLVRTEQVWCYSGFLVLAMELANGSLDDLLRTYRKQFDTPIIPEYVCCLLSQAADALDFLNLRKHVVNGQTISLQHCDIKPSNLLLFGETLKIGDFGLVSALTSQNEHEHRSRSGTINFCPPEVSQGRLSTQTDQYSLAVTYCLVRGGRLPFEDSVYAGSAGYTRPAPDLSMLPSEEQPIVARALSPVPQDRWPSCGDMMNRLARQVCSAATDSSRLALQH